MKATSELRFVPRGSAAPGPDRTRPHRPRLAVVCAIALSAGTLSAGVAGAAQAPALRAADAAFLAAQIPLFDLPYLIEHRSDDRLALPPQRRAAPARIAQPAGDANLQFLATALHFKGCCFTTSLAAADFTGQGHVDLVAGNGLSYDITVLLGDGAGGYQDPVTLPIDDAQFGYVLVKTADVTGDGNADIVATGFDADSILVFAGDGSGGFAAPERHTTGSGQTPRGLIIADVNGDGAPDLVTANGDTGDVSVLIADGSGSFAAAAGFVAGQFPNALAAGDVDGDGKLDLVTANADTLDISVLIGDGAGHFAAPQSLSIGANAEPRSVAIADVDGDGQADIVTANAGRDESPFPPPELPGTVSVLLGDGSGGFAAAVQLPAGDGDGRADAIAVADLTGDGHADIVVSRPIANSAALLAGDGAGGFAPAVTAATGVGPSPLLIADVTGDGKPDVVTGNQVGSTLSVLPSDGAGGFGFPGRHGAGAYPHSIASADLDGDGHVDVVTSNVMSSDVSVLLGDGAGGFGPEQRHAVGNSPTSIALADFDGDGHLDIVTANLGGGTVSVLLGDGHGSFSAAMDTSIGEGFQSPYSVAVADADGDGHADIATANTNVSNESISFLRGDGHGGFAAAVVMPVGSAGTHSPQGVAFADVTGDGHADIVTANLYSSDLSVLAGHGDGSFAAAMSLPTDLGPVMVAAADVDGDGIVDLVSVNQTGQSVSVLIGRGGGEFADAASYAIFTPETVQDYMPWPWGMVLADVDGDGRPDIVTANTQNDSVSVLLNDGSGGFGTFVAIDTGAHPGSVTAVDVDGDGDLDVISADRDNNDISVMRNVDARPDRIFGDGFERPSL